MASLATCPLCAKQLAIPDGTSSDDHAECPECDATFLLSNAFLTSLPTARILDAAETAPTLEMSAEDLLEPEQTLADKIEACSETLASEKVDLSDAEPSSKASPVASLASWESRLKNAIERDAAEFEDHPSSEGAPAADTPADPQPQTENPEFDFHIDPPAAEQSSEAEEQLAPQFDQPHFEQAEQLASEPVDLGAEEAAEAAELTIGLSKLHQQKPSRRFSPLKLAAVIIGPGLIGVFLGLYALLWIKGPSGDLIHLAKYLPPAMLPSSAAAPENENSTSKPESAPETTVLPEDTREPLGGESLVQEESGGSVPVAEAEPTDPRHDPEVQLATDEQPVRQVLNSLPEEFIILLTAARTASVDMVEGDLSTNAGVSRKGQAYMALCQLAQQFEATQLPDPDAQSQVEIVSAKELFVSIASESSVLGDLASIASRWWGYESRPNQGIFFAGQIQDLQTLGGKTLCYVALDQPATTTVIPVLLDQPPSGERDRIVVVGSIVSQPRSNLQGFDVGVPQVVVASFSYPLQP